MYRYWIILPRNSKGTPIHYGSLTSPYASNSQIQNRIGYHPTVDDLINYCSNFKIKMTFKISSRALSQSGGFCSFWSLDWIWAPNLDNIWPLFFPSRMPFLRQMSACSSLAINCLEMAKRCIILRSNGECALLPIGENWGAKPDHGFSFLFCHPAVLNGHSLRNI
jgi:hypothetical protein